MDPGIRITGSPDIHNASLNITVDRIGRKRWLAHGHIFCPAFVRRTVLGPLTFARDDRLARGHVKFLRGFLNVDGHLRPGSFFLTKHPYLERRVHPIEPRPEHGEDCHVTECLAVEDLIL